MASGVFWFQPRCFHLLFGTSVPGQGTSDPKYSTGTTQEHINNVTCQRDMTEIMFVVRMQGNIVEKGKNAGYQHIPLFQYLLLKGLFFSCEIVIVR